MQARKSLLYTLLHAIANLQLKVVVGLQLQLKLQLQLLTTSSTFEQIADVFIVLATAKVYFPIC
jgi:hypothetical protein